MNQANDHLEDKFQQLQKPLYRKKDHYLHMCLCMHENTVSCCGIHSFMSMHVDKYGNVSFYHI